MFLGEERLEKQIERESGSEARRSRARSREETSPVTEGAGDTPGAFRPGPGDTPGAFRPGPLQKGRKPHPSAGEPRGKARKIFERVEEILSSPALSSGGLVILRHPSSWRGHSPIPVHEKRTYGESTILIFPRSSVHDQIR
jgi:hypothetical protein